MDGKDQAERVKSAGRVLDIIERVCQAEGGMTFTGLGAETGIPKSSLHALLGVLTARRYLELDERTRVYTLGVKAWEMGQFYLKSRDIVREARIFMDRIAARLNETVQLANLDGAENVYLAKVDSTHPLRLQSEVGIRLSAHATGLGKALLAGLPDAEVERRFRDRVLQRMTSNTLTTVEALKAELGRIRERGFAVDNEEYTPGLFCVAVPVRGQSEAAAAAISMSVPVLRANTEVLSQGLALLAEASLGLTAKLGSQARDPVLLRLSDPTEARRALRRWFETAPQAPRFQLAE